MFAIFNSVIKMFGSAVNNTGNQVTATGTSTGSSSSSSSGTDRRNNNNNKRYSSSHGDDHNTNHNHHHNNRNHHHNNRNNNDNNNHRASNRDKRNCDTMTPIKKLGSRKGGEEYHDHEHYHDRGVIVGSNDTAETETASHQAVTGASEHKRSRTVPKHRSKPALPTAGSLKHESAPTVEDAVVPAPDTASYRSGELQQADDHRDSNRSHSQKKRKSRHLVRETAEEESPQPTPTETPRELLPQPRSGPRIVPLSAESGPQSKQHLVHRPRQQQRADLLEPVEDHQSYLVSDVNKMLHEYEQHLHQLGSENQRLCHALQEVQRRRSVSEHQLHTELEEARLELATAQSQLYSQSTVRASDSVSAFPDCHRLAEELSQLYEQGCAQIRAKLRVRAQVPLNNWGHDVENYAWKLCQELSIAPPSASMPDLASGSGGTTAPLFTDIDAVLTFMTATDVQSQLLLVAVNEVMRDFLLAAEMVALGYQRALYDYHWTALNGRLYPSLSQPASSSTTSAKGDPVDGILLDIAEGVNDNDDDDDDPVNDDMMRGMRRSMEQLLNTLHREHVQVMLRELPSSLDSVTLKLLQRTYPVIVTKIPHIWKQTTDRGHAQVRDMFLFALVNYVKWVLVADRCEHCVADGAAAEMNVRERTGPAAATDGSLPSDSSSCGPSVAGSENCFNCMLQLLAFPCLELCWKLVVTVPPYRLNTTLASPLSTSSAPSLLSSSTSALPSLCQLLSSTIMESRNVVWPGLHQNQSSIAPPRLKADKWSQLIQHWHDIVGAPTNAPPTATAAPACESQPPTKPVAVRDGEEQKNEKRD